MHNIKLKTKDGRILQDSKEILTELMNFRGAVQQNKQVEHFARFEILSFVQTQIADDKVEDRDGNIRLSEVVKSTWKLGHAKNGARIVSQQNYTTNMLWRLHKLSYLFSTTLWIEKITEVFQQ